MHATFFITLILKYHQPPFLILPMPLPPSTWGTVAIPFCSVSLNTDSCVSSPYIRTSAFSQEFIIISIQLLFLTTIFMITIVITITLVIIISYYDVSSFVMPRVVVVQGPIAFCHTPPCSPMLYSDDSVVSQATDFALCKLHHCTLWPTQAEYMMVASVRNVQRVRKG